MMPSSEALCASAGPVHDVADRPDAVGGGAQPPVDLDQPALAGLDAGRVETERLDVGRAARGDAQVVELLRAVAPVELDGVLARLHLLDARAGHDLDVLLAERASRRPSRCRGPRAAGSGRPSRSARPRSRSGRTPRRSRRPRRRRRRPPASRAARSSATCRPCRSRGLRSSCPGSAAAPTRWRSRRSWSRRRCRRP